ncbi:MAG: efflux RND transporter permease subunit [Opitutae bacterium]|nr:efflux RND transporter permease subunit [Opitutae bacterium]
MKVTEFSVRNPQFTILVFLALSAVGWLAFSSIPRAEDPDPNFPGGVVIVQCPGANQNDLEQQVARPIEDAIKELDRVAKLVTKVQDGVCVVNTDFEYGTDPDKKYDELLRQVNSVRPQLPAEIQSIEVIRYRTTDVALLQLALVSADASYARLDQLAEKLRKRFERVPGVRQAKQWACPEKQVRLSLDLDRLAQLQLPVGRVLDAVAGNNINLPGGAVELGPRRFNLKTSGYYASLDEIRAVPLLATGRATVRLGDVADVRWDYEDTEYVARFNGVRAVWVTATMKEHQNIFDVRAGLLAAADEYRRELPADVRLETGFDQSVNVSHRLGGLLRDFVIALVLVLITVLPLGWRASLLVLVSIPLSLAMGIAALHFTGHTLNQLTIVGLVIALGLLVDDSIVVVENIARFRRQGCAPIEAALQGTQQIAVAVLGTTFALVFAFLPLLALPGGSGSFIRCLPLAVVYTVLASLIVALTLMPFLASRLMTAHEESEGNRLLRGLQYVIHTTYRPLLHWCMKRRKTTLVGATLLFAGSLALVPAIGFSLFPVAGIPQFLVQIELPEGSSVSATDALARQVEARLATLPIVRHFQTNVGHGNPQVYYNMEAANLRANFAEILGTLHAYDPKRTPADLEQLRRSLATIPGVTITVREFENGPPIAAPIEVRIFGEDLTQLARVAGDVENLITAIPGTANMQNPLRVPRTDLQLVIDRPKAALLGVALPEIDRVARLGVAGLVATRYIESDGDSYGVRVMAPRGERGDLTAWSHLTVASQSGAAVPLGQVASLEFSRSPNSISRFDRQRFVGVAARVQPGFNTDRLTAEVEQRLAALKLPPGFRFEFGGEVESSRESFGGIGTAVIVAIFGVLAVLVLEFRSFRGTFIVASVIPLGVIGGLLALYLTGYTLSFVATIGFIALIGIEIKNSILLVDFTNQLRAQGVPLHEAIERAGEVRFLPVVLTTFTALGALLPVAVEGSGLFSPLAVVIVGGLISSLLLSRLVTPVMYSLIPPPGPEKTGV